MPRVKKTRKVTQSAPRPKVRPTENAPKRNKKLNGKAPGNRNSLKDGNPGGNQPGNTADKKDRRLGSKKKISLLSNEKAEQNNNKRLIPKFKTPQEELNYIENDTRLQALMDKMDDGQSVDKTEELYVDQLLARHKTLCELLGISVDADEEDAPQVVPESDDLLDMLEKSPGKFY
ncbi:Der GTPase-activating protein YihI [Planctobacterium marinum]|uniref:Der GTPase-activating protein YihI n=1 Tax=Planctobacterium marinum TaxID=1631968 RepID=A0AA48KNK7_9ALTE|nr:Der GTPase-activating protein YihI [Planctobacterium marinum]